MVVDPLTTFDKNKLPKCQAPGCHEDARMLIGKKFYCGSCAIKVTQYREDFENRYIEERFEQDVKDK